jgi:hypothetical protein
MTARTAIPRSLPPPLELRAADLLVGWIHGDVVRFRGFDSRRGAARAATVAHQAMVRRLARGNRETAAVTESDLDALRRSTDHTSASANGRPLTSVLGTSSDGTSDGPSGEFAFEIRVPRPVDELRMRGLAYVMHRALLSSGVAWPLVNTATEPEALTAMATRTAAETSGALTGIASRVLEWLRRVLGRASRAWSYPRPRTRQSELGSATG